MIYKIKLWDERFENHKTRILKYLDWVPIPNSQDGDGYTRLMEMERGPEVYGVWIAMLALASKCTPRGSLIDSNGNPHTAKSISRITRVPLKSVEYAISVLSAADFGWLTKDANSIKSNTAVEAAIGAAVEAAHETDDEQNRTERNGTEQNRNYALRRDVILKSAKAIELPESLEVIDGFRPVWHSWLDHLASCEDKNADRKLSAPALEIVLGELTRSADPLRLVKETLRRGKIVMFTDEELTKTKEPVRIRVPQ